MQESCAAPTTSHRKEGGLKSAKRLRSLLASGSSPARRLIQRYGENDASSPARGVGPARQHPPVTRPRLVADIRSNGGSFRQLTGGEPPVTGPMGLRRSAGYRWPLPGSGRIFLLCGAGEPAAPS